MIARHTIWLYIVMMVGFMGCGDDSIKTGIDSFDVNQELNDISTADKEEEQASDLISGEGPTVDLFDLQPDHPMPASDTFMDQVGDQGLDLPMVIPDAGLDLDHGDREWIERDDGVEVGEGTDHGVLDAPEWIDAVDASEPIVPDALDGADPDLPQIFLCESCDPTDPLTCGRAEDRCVDLGNGLLYCAIACTGPNSCPEGYECKEAVDWQGGSIGTQCLPISLHCPPCDHGLVNCDLDMDNGCEIDTNTDPSNCGACWNPCGPGQECVDGECVCPGGVIEQTCDDGVDNDCDGQADCYDPDCANLPCGTNGVICQNNACICPSGQGSEEVCNDGVDNDCDGTADCFDPDCANSSCGSNGRICQGGSCLCPDGADNEFVCNDMKDNDCDGLVDCLDLDCNGWSCGENGRVCQGNTCICPGGQEVETICDDGLDNDCDGTSDCQDVDCENRSCGSNGLICNNGLCSCPGGQDSEESCGDTIDNDCDGFIDCADGNCSGISCGSNGRICQGGICACPTGQDSETVCNDTIDNDCDSLFDCSDPDCVEDVCGAYGRICQGGICACPGGQTNESTCGDSTDNDCDGALDCDDLDCSNRSCGSHGQICQGTTCTCPGGQLSESTCNDEVDNDCDGLVDCSDTDCAGSNCGINGRLCQGGACVCPGDESPETTCDDGTDNDCDGVSDCIDSDCSILSCGPNGLICQSGSCICPTGQFPEADCGDAIDNDCDGSIDCVDFDCNGLACGESGLLCQAGRCACPGGEINESTCDDEVDNDCNGLVDCADSHCSGASCGVYGLTCQDGLCACPGREGCELICDDGLDNNCDGRGDCEDPCCDGQICGPDGLLCQSGACVCAGGESPETTCDDGFDNDCDGAIDCQDIDCASTPICPEQICDDGVDNNGDGFIDCGDVSCFHNQACPRPCEGVVAMASGGSHTCALFDTGYVKCWGSNSHGQLGDGTKIDKTIPVNVSDLSNVIALAAGGSHTCALLSGGGMKCWGYNYHGELGDGTWMNEMLSPVDVTGISENVIAIAAGSDHTCALLASGGVKCWGSESSGQLGDDGASGNLSMVPVDVIGLSSGVASISAGGAHTCAILTNGNMKCWGDNRSGQLGDGTTIQRNTPVDVIGFSSDAAWVTAGRYHTCAAMKSTGGLKCWGDNQDGQLGDGSTTNRSTPNFVSGLTWGITASSAGEYHTCAVASSGELKCWGENDYGQLGDGSTAHQTMPVNVSGLSAGAIAVEAANNHTCALMNTGNVLCWGINGDGRLGNGRTTTVLNPFDVSEMSSDIDQIAAGSSHTCALLNTGGVKCWGSNEIGQLGDGSMLFSASPVDVSGLNSGVTAIAVDGNHNCAILDSGGVKCWGSNRDGQLGDGTTTDRPTPVDVDGLSSGVLAIEAGRDHSCALLSTGGIMCWGNNAEGELGDGTVINRLNPVDVSGITQAISVIASDYHSCALLSTGGVKCWGCNDHGQLGDGTTTKRTTPVDVIGLLSGVTMIAAGGISTSSGHTCALLDTGGVKCWGDNLAGQIGDGTTIGRHTPVDVAWLSSGVATIAAGAYHTCALTIGSEMKCWGNNTYGQLGDGTTTRSTIPVDVMGLSQNSITAALGESHTCAVLDTGAVKCWGDDEYGQVSGVFQGYPQDVLCR